MLYNSSYKETDHISDVICDEPTLLQMMARFGLPLGVGEIKPCVRCAKRMGLIRLLFWLWPIL